MNKGSSKIEDRHRFCSGFKDTHKEIALSNETSAFTEYTNMDIWVIGTSNQLFIRDS